MFKPNELERFSMALDPQMKALEQRIMEDIVRRIRINGEITRAADWQIHRAYELGMSKRKITKLLQQELELSYKQVKTMYRQVMQLGYSRDEKLYKYKGVAQVPFEDNHGLQQLISSVAEQTGGSMRNITQTLGFAKKEGGKVKFTELSDYYQQTLDGAMLDIASGAFDYNTVLKRVVGELTNSGLRTVDYASGKSFRVESAARMAIKTGMSQITAKINEDNARELNTDTFEVSYHGGARPSHQVWQGRVFTRAQLGSICGLGSAGGLCGVNCYHDYYPFIEGISERTYTDEELDRMNAEENNPREFGGKQYTAYDATQRQRSLKRTMRAQRQKIHLLKEGGADEDDIINAQAQYRATSAEYSRFSKAMGIPQERERVSVDGLGDISVENKVLDKSGNSGIINTGAVSGALNPLSKAAEKHAVQYYESVRHMKTDTNRISENTGIAKDKIDKIKNHVFIKEHDLIEGRKRFDPSYDMAVSWQKLINGNFGEKDIVLLKHEYAELRYMEKGLTQDEAHIKASRKYNYAKYCE